jgi:hypothetical protein
MFTKNWYKLIAANCFGEDSAKSWGVVTFTGATSTNTTGAWANMDMGISSGSKYPALNRVALTTSTKQQGGVAIGSGRTPATLNDYKLESMILNSSLSASTVVNKTKEDGRVTLTSLITITNGDTSDITIGEVGAFMNTSISSADSACVLLERTVLDTPVTIPAGGVGQVTYTVQFNYPTT